MGSWVSGEGEGAARLFGEEPSYPFGAKRPVAPPTPSPGSGPPCWVLALVAGRQLQRICQLWEQLCTDKGPSCPQRVPIPTWVNKHA